MDAYERVAKPARRIPRENWTPGDLPRLSTRTVRALLDLRARPWWVRAWVVEEITCPSKPDGLTAVWCGNRRVAWNDIVMANRLLDYALGEISLTSFKLACNPRVSELHDLRALRETFRQLPLVYLLSTIRSCEATDPRDKVYAALPIAQYGDKKDLCPNYSMPVEDIYREVAISIITQDKNLDLLAYCYPGQSFDIPSWVPDWTCKPSSHPLPKATDELGHSTSARIYNACGGRTSELAFEYGKYLLVQGIEVDVITNTSLPMNRDERVMSSTKPILPWQDDEVAEEILTSWNQLLFPDNKDRPYVVTGKTVADVIRHIICGDLRVTGPRRDRLGRGGSVRVPFREGSETVSGSRFDSFMFERRVFNTCNNRRLIETRRGCLGISSMHAEIGDRVCILFGSSVPFVLRPSGKTWKIIGEAYVHGIMDGEALLDISEVQQFVLS
jgi:hypothetical protein